LYLEDGYGIAKNHGFIDGNKRTAYVVIRLFLMLNGHDRTAKGTERVLVFEKLGRGGLSQMKLPNGFGVTKRFWNDVDLYLKPM
jgi:death-on-curing protein